MENYIKEIEQKWQEMSYDMVTLEATSRALRALCAGGDGEIDGEELLGQVERLIDEYLIKKILDLEKKHDDLERALSALKKKLS